MEKTTSTSIEITIISAEELRLGRRPLNKDAIVAVRSDSHASSQASTGVDRDGGSYPCWNEKLRVSLPPSARWISVEVYCRAGARGLQAVAAARVPVSDFRWPEDYLHFLSYRLRDGNGAANGIINFSVRVIGGGGGRGVHGYCAPLWAASGKKEEGGVGPVGYPVGYGH